MALVLVDHAPGCEDELAAACAALVREGHVVRRCASSEEMLAAAADEAPALAVLYHGHAGSRALEACARLRGAHGTEVAILVLYDGAVRDVGPWAYEAGADDALPTPITAVRIVGRLRLLVELQARGAVADRARADAEERVRQLDLLHAIGRDWSSASSLSDFARGLTGRAAALVGAARCVLGGYDPRSRTIHGIAPAHGVPDATVAELRYVVQPEHRALWNFRSGRCYLSNDAGRDPRLVPALVQALGAQSALLVPLLSAGRFVGLLAALDKPAGFVDADTRLLSTLGGPAATFLHCQALVQEEEQHQRRLDSVGALSAAMSASGSRADLVRVTASRLCRDVGCARVEIHAIEPSGLQLEAEAGEPRPPDRPVDKELLRWVARGAMPLAAPEGSGEVAVPVRAGGTTLAVLTALPRPGRAFAEPDVSLLCALAGQLAVALQKTEGAERTGRLARQLTTLYELGLEVAAARDLPALFARAAGDAGRLIDADHTSVLRLDRDQELLQLFTVWARHPTAGGVAPTFRMGEGVAGRVARDRVPVLLNEPAQETAFVPRGRPVARLLCIPVLYYDREREADAVFGVMNATRAPGRAPFNADDLDDLTRFASQLGVAVANSMAFSAERERSEELALVSRLLAQITGNLSRERVLETAARRVHESFGFPVVMIVVPDREAGVNRVAFATGRGPLPARWPEHPLQGGLAGRVLRERRTVVVPDVRADRDYLELLPGIRSAGLIPVLVGGEVAAILHVAGETVGALTPSQVLTLETLADGIAIALGNAELYGALQRTNAQLVELNRMKTELVNIVAHDFRAPLAGIMGNAELLEWRPDAPREERMEQARAILDSSNRMAELVQKTLKTTRLEGGQLPFEFAVVDVAEVARAAAGRVPRSASHPLRVTAPEDPVACWGDAGRLAEVVENLLSNALRYSPDGGEVRLDVRQDGESAVVTVEDRGIGVDPAHHARLFRPFSRVREGRAAAIEGSGLGLYICARIVSAHGGRLLVDSAVGRGARFTFTVPLFGLAAQTRRPVLLLGASDEGTRREAAQAARALGWDVVAAADGVEVVETATRVRPAAILLDRVLPRLTAHDVAERLRDQLSTCTIPIVVLASTQEMGGAVGEFAACVPKPVDGKELLATLEALSAEA